jgi:23S rRNA pseudouridine1911/1915/1917 synthase
VVLHAAPRLLVIDKPGILPVSPGERHPAGTLANALRGLGIPLSTVEGPLRPGIVHRLDAGTSGAMVVARDDDTHRRLADLFRAHAIERRYLALVEGEPAWDETHVDRSLGRRRAGRKAYAVRDDGRPARTALRVLARRGGWSVVEAVPETGRTHQLRVHLASVGHPILGDTLYGGGQPAIRRAARLGVPLRRPALHSHRIACAELALDVTAPPPPDLAAALT